MNVGPVALVTLVLLISSCSGCMFLPHTKFSLLSLVVDDDRGFPRLVVKFNTSDTTTLTLVDPEKQPLFSDVYYNGLHNESMYLSGYRRNPPKGTYAIKAYDASKNTIFQNDLMFKGQNLSVVQVQDDWWQNTSSSLLVALHMTFHNSGDLPSYPYKVEVQLGDMTSEVVLIPTVILPYQSTTVTCFVPLGPLSSGDRMLSISISDKEGTRLMRTTHAISSTTPVPSWEFSWGFLGGHTLRLPNVDWFYDYYKGLDRFDITDYAAYVFDSYDDGYIYFTAKQLLAMTHGTIDVEKINFIASFVQNIPYMKDDPNNDSYEYPRYPIETLKEQRGDCEDKAILGAALLARIGYNVSLLRLPHHMAVGVHLDKAIGAYDYYVDQYYYMEMTATNSPIGKVPPEYQGLSNVTVYPISLRPLLVHSWMNATRYKTSTGLDYIKLKMLVKNLGSASAASYEIRGAFYDVANRSYNENMVSYSVLDEEDQQIAELQVTVPEGVSTVLITRIYLDGVMVHDRESSSHFP